jgi:hypothetical protein
LILPYGNEGNSDIWQATSGFFFRMAGGYVGQFPLVPAEFTRYHPLVFNFFNLADFLLSNEQLKEFLAQKGVNAIIVSDHEPHLWRESRSPDPSPRELSNFTEDEKAATSLLFGTLGSPIQVGGVSL